jgi:hypothetical protein
MLLTASDYLGDTANYVQDVLAFDRSGYSAAANPLWEFGHLYWRPLGWLLFKTFGRLTPYLQTGESNLSVTVMFISTAVVSGFVCALLFYWLASRVVREFWSQILVATACITFYAFLNYAHSGSAYVTGLLGLLAGLCAVIRATDGKSFWLYALLAGVASGFAVLIWFPYAVAMLGVIAAAWLWNSDFRMRGRLVIVFVAALAAVVSAGYLFAIWQLQFSSMAELKLWFLSASHGWSQSRRLVRLPNGLARSFLILGDDAVLVKRFVLRDPYAHVTILDLARQMLWKLAAFYSFLLAIIWLLSRRLLWICAAAAIPILFFAVAIFEPGSAERYLPLYPFVCIAAAYALSQRSWIARVVLAFLILSIGVNVWTLSKNRVGQRIMLPAMSRLESLQGKVSPKGLVAVIALTDTAYRFTEFFPFHPLNRQRAFPVYDVVEIANQRVLTWKRDFAIRALNSFNASEKVWITKRFLSGRPLPEWKWTEGDDPRIAWKDLPAFFKQFSYGSDVGGDDGFVEMEATPTNLAILRAVAR